MSIVLIIGPHPLAREAITALRQPGAAEPPARLSVIEVETEASDLGPHAKVSLADDHVCCIAARI